MNLIGYLGRGRTRKKDDVYRGNKFPRQPSNYRTKVSRPVFIKIYWILLRPDGIAPQTPCQIQLWTSAAGASS